jgi:hypothetical protein
LLTKVQYEALGIDPFMQVVPLSSTPLLLMLVIVLSCKSLYWCHPIICPRHDLEKSLWEINPKALGCRSQAVGLLLAGLRASLSIGPQVVLLAVMFRERLACQRISVIASTGVRRLLAVDGTRLMAEVLRFISDELPGLSPM